MSYVMYAMRTHGMDAESHFGMGGCQAAQNVVEANTSNLRSDQSFSSGSNGEQSCRRTSASAAGKACGSWQSQSGCTDDNSTEDGPNGTVETNASSISSEEFVIPGLSSGESEGEAVNTLEAHQNGTCKPCRFFQLKAAGCRLEGACRFCHYCSREEARTERLRIKYDDRRAKRRLRFQQVSLEICQRRLGGAS
mmetsp:Transcript_68796/g.163878  ORF Transcript_68796/g.163878 Transcript_68796/m.163878 type:complete len:194 (+) Transcript_68796:90-671(+)